MYKYGQSTSNNRIMEQARGVLNLALLSPQYKGAFPTIFWLGSNNSINWNIDAGWASLCSTLPVEYVPHDCQLHYHAFDMSWTAYWLLRWLELVPNEDRILT